MVRRIWLVCVGMAVVGACGCGDAKKPPPVPVKGTVNLDGKPLADGEIGFASGGDPAVILPIKDGAFSGNAPVGKDHVDVRAFKQGPPLSTDPTNAPTKTNIIPDRFNGPNSTLTADVPAGGASDLKFEVTSH